MKMLYLMTLALFTITTYANPNGCDDYLQRHYKQDLVPVSLKYQKRDWIGDIRMTHQYVYLKVKNQGQVDMNARDTDRNGFRKINIRLGGRSYQALLRIPVDSGQYYTLQFRITNPSHFIRSCSMVNVHIDYDHKVGQWGCQVWNNDQKSLKFVNKITNCRIVRRPPRPIPIPRKPIPRRPIPR